MVNFEKLKNMYVIAMRWFDEIFQIYENRQFNLLPICSLLKTWQGGIHLIITQKNQQFITPTPFTLNKPTTITCAITKWMLPNDNCTWKSSYSGQGWPPWCRRRSSDDSVQSSSQGRAFWWRLLRLLLRLILLRAWDCLVSYWACKSSSLRSCRRFWGWHRQHQWILRTLKEKQGF